MSAIEMVEVGNPIIPESEFSLILVSKCPHCGSPIWARRPKKIDGIPESLFSCECRFMLLPTKESHSFPRLTPPQEPFRFDPGFVPPQTWTTSIDSNEISNKSIPF